MLQSRLIPCLLVRKKGLVKSVKFGDHKYVGDPINAVKIFNEKEVDELIVLDIDATTDNREPDYKLIESLAVECRMPLCYGGGIKNTLQANTIFSLGVEKVAFSSAVIEYPSLVTDISMQVGSQSVVVVLDVKKKLFGSRYEIYTKNGTTNTGRCPIEFAKELQTLGVGEIVLNSIDNDGMMKGYDLELIRKVKKVVSTPLTVLGGAGSLQDISRVVNEHKLIGVAAGSLFVFKGKYRAVLISYPQMEEKNKILNNLSI